MRAREFTINIPVHITINGDGEPVIDMASDKEEDTNAVFVSPLQQELELKKAAIGKTSNVIDDITDNDDEDRLNEASDELARIMKLLYHGNV